MANVSSKDLGLESESGREVKLIITDEEKILNISARGDSGFLGGDIEIPIKFIPSRHGITIQLTVKVPDAVRPYQKARGKKV